MLLLNHVSLFLTCVGSKVIEVTATDADDPTTANGELAYTLLEGGDFFNIDSTTGRRCSFI